MVRKRQWFLLGLVGTLVGLAARLVRSRRPEQIELGTFEPPSAEK